MLLFQSEKLYLMCCFIVTLLGIQEEAQKFSTFSDA